MGRYVEQGGGAPLERSLVGIGLIGVLRSRLFFFFFFFFTSFFLFFFFLFFFCFFFF